MRPRIKPVLVNSLVCVISIVVAISIAEGVLRLLSYPKERPLQTSHPSDFQETRENVEFLYDFSTNSQGLRYREVPLEKAPDSRRIFVVGDSFTEGQGVRMGERFTDILEDSFSRPDRPVLFINGGLSGTDPIQYGRLFFDKGLKYHPDALLVCIFANDLAGMPDIAPTRRPATTRNKDRLLGPARSAWPRVFTAVATMRARRELGHRTATSDFVADVSREAERRAIPQKRIAAWKHSLPDDLVAAVNRGAFTGSILSNGLLYPEYWTDSIDVFSTTAQTKWVIMTKVLSEIVDQARNDGVEVAFVFVPSYFQYDPESHEASNPTVRAGTLVKRRWLSEETQIEKRLASWTKQSNVPFLDLTPTFRRAIEHEHDLNWKLDGHWTPKGHRVAAQAMMEWLSSGRAFSFIGSS